jgi:hypothetical protein
MTFQGPKDFTTNVERYQKVVAYLLYIQRSHPSVLEILLLSPQFEYEVEACRYRKRWALKYLSMLKNTVQKYEVGNQPTVDEVRLQKVHLSAFN